MDTSIEYIEMCRKAQEIQRMRPPIKKDTFSPIVFFNGDIIYVESVLRSSNVSHIEVVSFNEKQFNKGVTPIHIQDNQLVIWLPRQDQLQEMLKYKDTVDLLQFFVNFIALENIPFHGHKKGDVPLKHIPSDFDSMEKIWLYATMYNLHNKQWSFSKKEWIIRNENNAEIIDDNNC